MRLIPIITAILVTAFLYGIIIERDAVMAFARGEGIDTRMLGAEEAGLSLLMLVQADYRDTSVWQLDLPGTCSV